MKLKKGGTARIVIENFADNDTFVIPAGFRIEAITVKKSGTTAGNIAIGTADAGTQIVDTTALSTANGNVADLTVALALFGSDTTAYITVSSAATGNLSVQLQKLF
jgi:hypothetical protein